VSLLRRVGLSVPSPSSRKKRGINPQRVPNPLRVNSPFFQYTSGFPLLSLTQKNKLAVDDIFSQSRITNHESPITSNIRNSHQHLIFTCWSKQSPPALEILTHIFFSPVGVNNHLQHPKFSPTFFFHLLEQAITFPSSVICNQII
jgi:hypothetical protein